MFCGALFASRNGYEEMKNVLAASSVIAALAIIPQPVGANTMQNSQQIDPNGSGRIVLYPKDAICPVFTSLFGSMTNVDGSLRIKPHKGVDGGSYGDAVLAPAAGRVLAIWETNTGRGIEWSVLLSHDIHDASAGNDAAAYLSQFDHFERNDISHLNVGQRVNRGDRIGQVRHPGGNANSPAKIHWEVYEVPASSKQNLAWTTNSLGHKVWRNSDARLINPLDLLSAHQSKGKQTEIRIVAFASGQNYSKFKGFTHIFRCKGPPQSP